MVDPKFEVEPVSDRHPKWVRVEPGHVIPAGQPYRVEYRDSNKTWTASEFVAGENGTAAGKYADIFVDSSWKPPLVLPETPTWGIAVTWRESKAGRWALLDDRFSTVGASWEAGLVLDFIPLTDEQVARIEAAR